MKKLVLVVGLFLICGIAWADVTAEIVGKDIDQNGNIVIRTQYKIDGVEVESRYPKDSQGRYYWQTRYSIQNFFGMDDAATQARIDQDLKAFGESLITKPFQAQVHDTAKAANLSFYNTKLTETVGRSVTVKNAKMTVDTDFNGIPDKEWTCKTDGTKNEENYTPPVSGVTP